MSGWLRVFAVALAFGFAGKARAAEGSADPRSDFFEQRIRPVLVERCYECHSAGSKKLKGGLRLDSRAGMLRGGDTKPAIVPGAARDSLLIEALGYSNPDLQMPPQGRLSDDLVKDFAKWINDGAFDPRTEQPANPSPEIAGKHWAFQPIGDFKPPTVASRTPALKNPIDRFVTAKLEERGLKLGAAADRRTLIRRAAYDLTGLPPAPKAITEFVQDPAADAFERMIERLLASPRYGERWGRWWLDVARYADSNGQDENKVMANAWRYRDWVIRSFNSNLPFDSFITQQLAGDLLPSDGLSEAGIFERWTATGFLVLGPKMLAEQDKPKLVMDLVDEQIDVVSRAFLGLTVSCARCHDHKFDPISTRDYYALAGIFRSTKTMANLGFVSKFNERRITGALRLAALEAHEKKLTTASNDLQRAVQGANEALRANWQREALVGVDAGFAWPKDARLLYPAPAREQIVALEKARDALNASAPAPPEFALAVEEEKPTDLPVHIRGSHLNLATNPVPRGFIRSASVGETAAPPVDRSGRLELAQWLISPKQPLTARVIVNRIWQAHFGEGLVRTPDNFGVRGEAPSHPELLDWLARDFQHSGWDVKALHRLILTSGTWRQEQRRDSPELKRAARVDPDNRLLWHFPRQRLEAEMIRDALLAVSDRLDLTAGGSLVAWKNDEYTPKDTASESSVRRSVYLPVVRDRVFSPFTIFDFANPSVATAKRTPTVVSHQALFFLNSPLVKDSARAFARNLIATAPDAPNVRINYAFERAFGRLPSERESRRALQFVSEAPVGSETGRELSAWSAWCQVLLATSEFVYRE